ncbi:MAG TPA: zinc-binding dehydrogenase [Xanthobacteraceae bacterium]|jgi:S-(hydroxymethyl)glutathione dehydrogenase/alcohol dehydrogenase|nr:zinc-binding dehydrogenase [Xanthobacteraceae bacterium]
MAVHYKAAVLHSAGTPLVVEAVEAAPLGASDVLVRIGAAGLCHTDLEVIDGALRYPMPIVLGHEAAGVIEDVGTGVARSRLGEKVALSWNPHCGHCFYCDRGLPILCEDYLAKGPQAVQFDGHSKARRQSGEGLKHLMFLGAFGEYCIVQDQQAIAVPAELPFDRACLIGCGVMTGVGAALNVAHIGRADVVMVVGCGAVGLAAVQGARLAGARKIIAVDIDDAKLKLAAKMGATSGINARSEDVVAVAKRETDGRGVDCVLEAAGNAAAFPLTLAAVRPGGEVVWLGKIDVDKQVSFRWGSLMQEKRIRR